MTGLSLSQGPPIAINGIRAKDGAGIELENAAVTEHVAHNPDLLKRVALRYLDQDSAGGECLRWSRQGGRYAPPAKHAWSGSFCDLLSRMRLRHRSNGHGLVHSPESPVPWRGVIRQASAQQLHCFFSEP